MSSRGVVALGAAALVIGAASFAPAQEKVDGPPAAPLGSVDELLPNGTRRVYVQERAALTPAQIEELLDAGKADQVDPATGTMLAERIVDHLPLNWGAPGPEGARVDSFGNPIVNEVPGWPGWAQWNVDALRAELRAALERVGDPEADAVAGNLLGQAIVRRIPVADFVDLADEHVVTPGVAAAALAQLHLYENVKAAHAPEFGYVYQRTVYGEEISRLAAAHGRNLDEVLALESSNDVAGRAAPSGCYSRTTFSRGMTILTGATVIWNGAVFIDDSISDVPIGFPFYFYPCDDDDPNTSVRVCSNGYVTFFQQGGGADSGASFGNDVITDAQFPDGYAAPFWDDFSVAAQGIVDEVRYLTEGATGDRVFTAEWYSVSHLGGDVADWNYFQVKLFERTQHIEFHYGISGGFFTPDSITTATIGMEDYSGLDGDCGPDCSNTNVDAPASNYSFAPFRPFNDNCAQAATLSVNGGFTAGDLVGFTVATQDGTGCGSSSTNPDLWYRYVAPCSGTLTVNTCGTHDAPGTDLGMDTVLALFDACGGIQLACTDDTLACATDTSVLRDSQVTAALTEGQVVLIRVSHFGSFDSPVDGDFQLSWSFDKTGSPPPNDDCAQAQRVAVGSIAFGDLGCATNDGTSSCGSSSQNKDLWYVFSAPCAGTLNADMCGSGALGGVDPTLTVFDSCGGAQLTCADDSVGVCGASVSLDSAITLAMARGQTVLLRVSHFGSNIADGRFRLNIGFVTDAGPAPANDTCAGAAFLRVGNVVTASTCNATVDLDAPSPCGTSVSQPGVWYRTIGSGETYTVDTCGAGTVYDTKLSVYRGACGALTCISGIDDSGCGWLGFYSSSVTWATSPGEEYYILVHGFSSTGQFELALTSTTPANDDCTGALPLACGSTVSGSTRSAGGETLGFCGTGDGIRGGVWYDMVGAGGPVRLATCNPGTNYDTKIRVFRNSCGALTCVAGNDDTLNCPLSFRSQVDFVAGAGVTYHVLVHGFSSEEGEFEMTATCGCPCERDFTAGVNVFDLLGYLDDWFAGAVEAEFDATPGVNVFDLLGYLDCWFPASAGAPCP